MNSVTIQLPHGRPVTVAEADEPNIFQAVVAIAAAIESQNLDAGDAHLRDAASFLKTAANTRK